MAIGQHDAAQTVVEDGSHETGEVAGRRFRGIDDVGGAA